jgi:hypothetical protein
MPCFILLRQVADNSKHSSDNYNHLVISSTQEKRGSYTCSMMERGVNRLIYMLLQFIQHTLQPCSSRTLAAFIYY